MNKFLLSLFACFALLSGASFAQEISFGYSSGDHFGKDCLVPIDVYADAKGKPISATDLVMESSMKYVDFVPANAFPYVFPPVIRSNGLLHVVAFSVSPDQVLTGKAKVGTLYFKDTSTNTDGSVKFYFLGTGNTTDTNLSYGGEDFLQSVESAYVVLDQAPCSHAAAPISGGLSSVDPQLLITQTADRISSDYSAYAWHKFVQTYLWLGILLILLIILILLAIIYRKRIQAFISHRHVGNTVG